MGMKPTCSRPGADRGGQGGNRRGHRGDQLTSSHMRNWMDCIRSRKEPNAPIEAGYQHSIATIMTNAAYRTGSRWSTTRSARRCWRREVFQY